jgi:hypothetical protein
MSRRNKAAPEPLRPDQILERPIRSADGSTRGMCAFELGIRSNAIKAIQGDMKAAKYFLQQCRQQGLLERVNPDDNWGGVLRIPKDWNTEEWKEMCNKHGPPPWPGERDGLIPAERWKPHYGKRPR